MARNRFPKHNILRLWSCEKRRRYSVHADFGSKNDIFYLIDPGNGKHFRSVLWHSRLTNGDAHHCDGKVRLAHEVADDANQSGAR